MFNFNFSKDKDFQHPYKNYTFRGKRGEEEIVLILRRHWFVALIQFLPIIFFAAIIIFILITDESILRLVFPSANIHLARLFEIFVIMFLWTISFTIWIDYYLDTWILTDHRIINIEQMGFFRREVSELEHEKIQDVTTEVHGIIPTVLKFGYVHIQTAGEKSRFIFKQVPDPVFVRTMIMKLQQQAVLEGKRKEGAILRGKL